MPNPWESAQLPDGEVFHLVQAAGKPEQLTQLSPNKRRAIESLCAHPRSKRMLNVLRQVLRYRGLRRGLRLGNIYRLLRMKCPHEHTHYLKHILRVWSYVMGPNRAAGLDFRSVQLLEGRSPTLSTEDYDFICRQFKLGSLFPSISDTAQRRAIVCRLLHVPAMIPSVHTFMEDTKYLLPCALAMRRLTSDGPQDTIRTSLWHHFRPGHRCATDRSAFLEGYRALWLFAMQNFPDLTGALPLLDGRGRKRRLQLSGKSTEHCWRQFGSLARSLGFASPEIQRLVGPGASSADAPPEALYPKLTQYSTTDWKLRARCGMPSESSFLASRPFLTLNHIDGSLSTGTGGSLTAFAVARNIFQAFLGYLPPLGNRSSAIHEAVLPSPREGLSNASASSHSGQTRRPRTCSSSDSTRSLRTDASYGDGDSIVAEDGATPVPAPVLTHRRLVPSTSPRQMSYTPSVYSIGDQRSSPDQAQGICLQSDLAPLQRLNPFRESRLPLGAADLEPSPATPPSHLGLRGQPTLHHPQDFHPIAAQPDGRAILYEVGCPAVVYRLPLARVVGLFNIYFQSHPNFWYAIWADNQLRALQPAAVPEMLRVNVVISGSRECWIRAQRGQFTRTQSHSRSPTWLDEIGYSQYFGRQDDS